MTRGSGRTEFFVESTERAAPAWCRTLMNLSLWGAVATGVFLMKPLGLETARAVCLVLMSLMALMWLFHGVFVRRIPVAFSISTLAGVGLAVFFIASRWHEPGEELALILAPAVLFLVIPGAFTFRQVSGFLAFLSLAGVIEVFYCIVSPTLFDGKPSFFQSIEEGGAFTGTFRSEAELTVFLACCACASTAFALRSLAVMAPPKGTASLGGIMNRLASPGASLALLATLAALLALVPLFFCRSLFPFPTALLAGIVLVVTLAAKKRIAAAAAAVVMIVLVLAGAANLSRSLPAGTDGGEGDRSVLAANMENLVQGIDLREGGSLAAPPPESGEGWSLLAGKGEFGNIQDAFGRTGLFLVLAFLALLLAEGFRAMALYDDSGPLLAAGAAAGLLALGLTGLWGSFLSNPGLALLAAAFCAMTAAGGEYDEEFEEIEILS